MSAEKDAAFRWLLEGAEDAGSAQESGRLTLEMQVESPMGRRLVLREVTEPGQDGRSWDVEDPSTGLQFRATLTGRSLHGAPEGWTPLHGEPDEGDVLLAVCHAVDNSIVALRGNALRGIRYEINVNCQEVYEARQMAVGTGSRH